MSPDDKYKPEASFAPEKSGERIYKSATGGFTTVFVDDHGMVQVSIELFEQIIVGWGYKRVE